MNIFVAHTEFQELDLREWAAYRGDICFTADPGGVRRDEIGNDVYDSELCLKVTSRPDSNLGNEGRRRHDNIRIGV